MSLFIKDSDVDGRMSLGSDPLPPPEAEGFTPEIYVDPVVL